MSSSIVSPRTCSNAASGRYGEHVGVAAAAARRPHAGAFDWHRGGRSSGSVVPNTSGLNAPGHNRRTPICHAAPDRPPFGSRPVSRNSCDLDTEWQSLQQVVNSASPVTPAAAAAVPCGTHDVPCAVPDANSNSSTGPSAAAPAPTTPTTASSSAAAPVSANRGSTASSSGRQTPSAGLFENTPELQRAVRLGTYPNTKLGRQLKEIWLKSHSGVDLIAQRQSLKHLKEVHVILFGVGQKHASEGIYSLRGISPDGLPLETIICFECQEDAERYACLLEPLMTHQPHVCSLSVRELLGFCKGFGYRCRLELRGSLLFPPDYNVTVTDWERSMRLRQGQYWVLDSEPEIHQASGSSSPRGDASNDNSSSSSAKGQQGTARQPPPPAIQPPASDATSSSSKSAEDSPARLPGGVPVSMELTEGQLRQLRVQLEALLPQQSAEEVEPEADPAWQAVLAEEDEVVGQGVDPMAVPGVLEAGEGAQHQLQQAMQAAGATLAEMHAALRTIDEDDEVVVVVEEEGGDQQQLAGAAAGAAVGSSQEGHLVGASSSESSGRPEQEQEAELQQYLGQLSNLSEQEIMAQMQRTLDDCKFMIERLEALEVSARVREDSSDKQQPTEDQE